MLTIALAQLNPVVGGLQQNTEKIIAMIRSCQSDIVVFPELVLTGYPPEDLLHRADFMNDVEACLRRISAVCTDTVAIIGSPVRQEGHLINAAVVMRDGKQSGLHAKLILPNYGVFDEKRYFISGQMPYVLSVQGVKIALAVCEDLWEEGDIEPDIRQEQQGNTAQIHEHYAELDAELIISINASPFCHGKSELRKQVISRRSRQTGKAIVYVNLVGGQDELVFDGQSMVVGSDGRVNATMAAFHEAYETVRYDAKKRCFETWSELNGVNDDVSESYQALVLGIKDYARKNGFLGAILGLSGGIDSSLTLALAVDALGHENVEAVLMPSRYTSDLSNEEAIKQCELLDVKWCSLPIESPHAAFEALIGSEINIAAGDLTSQNIQARCRGVILMAFSNQSGRLLLTTGNKSEMAMGYATLYGDMAGGFAPLKDVPKTWVYRLSRYRNSISEAIPDKVIERPPSAELAPNQKDSDSLPPYDVLDSILEKYIEEDWSAEKIIALGYEEELVKEVIGKVIRNEYKRRQAPPGIKITRRSFGRERRYPISASIDEVI